VPFIRRRRGQISVCEGVCHHDVLWMPDSWAKRLSDDGLVGRQPKEDDLVEHLLWVERSHLSVLV